MNIYLVTMEHPEGPEWNTFVREHVLYLKQLIHNGTLIASGPLKNTSLRAGFLIFRAESLQQVRMMVNADPFAREKLITKLEIQQWDPLFGQLSTISSQQTVGELQDLVD
ncbi:YciI family protein [Tatumella sp. UBA2305]|uniref:YciI family protein n=1 Tax=Tatumella sp. UBA2305 TaxID=1947647 RepID=UPI0025E6106A|nr:YciI family protein [Tatumella sp. UBA2305]